MFTDGTKLLWDRQIKTNIFMGLTRWPSLCCAQVTGALICMPEMDETMEGQKHGVADEKRTAKICFKLAGAEPEKSDRRARSDKRSDFIAFKKLHNSPGRRCDLGSRRHQPPLRADQGSFLGIVKVGAAVAASVTMGSVLGCISEKLAGSVVKG
jgi:hypothetical protein